MKILFSFTKQVSLLVKSRLKSLLRQLMIAIPLNLSGLSPHTLHCLGQIASTELVLRFPLRVFRCCQNCFGLFVNVFSFFILFPFHFCFLEISCVFVLLLKILILVNDFYVFQIFLEKNCKLLKLLFQISTSFILSKFIMSFVCFTSTF